MNTILCPNKRCENVVLHPKPARIDQSGECHLLAVVYSCPSCSIKITEPDLRDTRQHSNATGLPLGTMEPPDRT